LSQSKLGNGGRGTQNLYNRAVNKLRAALDHPVELRTEYRVVTRSGLIVQAETLEEAREIATYGLLEGEVPPPIQAHEVWESDWTDLPEEER
jgi:hypothetical protein